MAFTVEDGTGVAGATSYVALADADSYHADRANTAWDALADAAKQAALIKATDFLDMCQDWYSEKTDEDNPLEWPRYDVEGIASDEIPQQIKTATIRLAGEISDGVDPTATVDATDLLTKVKADNVEVSFGDHAQVLAGRGGVTFPWLSGLLAGLSGSQGGSIVARKILAS